MGKERELVKAAVDNDLKAISRLVAEGADVNRVAPEGGYKVFPLEKAVYSENWDAVALLVRNGAREWPEGYRRAHDYDDKPMLYLAAEAGHEDAVRAMLEAGWRPDVTGGKHYWTPLLVASYFGHSRIVRLLIDAGADIEETGDDCWTPLWYAAYHYNPDCARMLLEAGANPNGGEMYKYGGDEETPYAPSPLCNARSEDVAKLLIDAGARVNVQDGEGLTPLCRAALGNHPGLVKFLLDEGANPNFRNGQPMRCAAEGDAQKRIFSSLLNAGAPLETPRETSPLCVAAKFGKLGALKALRELGAKDPEALNAAAAAGFIYCLRYLIEEGIGDCAAAARAAARSGSEGMLFYLLGRFPDLRKSPVLHGAIEGGRFKLAETLLDGGADPNHADGEGQTPLCLLLQRNHLEEAKRILPEHTHGGVQECWASWKDIENTHLLMALRLVEHGADPDLPDGDGRSPFWHALRNGWDNAAADYLASLGIDPDRADKEGNRPIHAAAMMDRCDSVYAAARAGADINARNNAGDTPLILAARRCGDRYSSAVFGLVVSGAAMEIRDAEGHTAAEIAAGLEGDGFGFSVESALGHLEWLRKKEAVSPGIAP